MTEKISEIARQQFWKLAEDAKLRGRDLAEVLDREGFLLTPERRKEIQAQAFEEIAELARTTSAHQWTTGTTQADLMSALARNLDKLAKDRRSE